MTEGDIWRTLRTWIPDYVVRIENAISSGLPDVLWCPSGLAVFLELKVISGFHIYVRNSQIVFGIHARKSIPVNQHLFVVGDMVFDAYAVYTYSTISSLPPKITGTGKVKISLEGITPDFLWRDDNDVSNFATRLEREAKDGWDRRTSSSVK